MNKKLDCKFKDKINAYLDNELNKADFDQVKDHLLHCSVCQEEVRKLNELNSFLAPYQELEVPEVVTDKILATVSEFAETKTGKKHRFLKYTAAASIAASFLIGSLFGNLIFQNSNDSLADYSLGQESLYSYYVTE